MRYRTRALLGAAVLPVLAGAVLWSQPRWLIDRIAQRYPGCLYRVSTNRPVVALTVDDGPDAATTPLILNELRQQSAHATFFLIASRVPGQQPVVNRMIAEGHEIGNHGMRDRAAIRLSRDAFVRDLDDAGRVLSTHGPVRWARPGSGWYSHQMVAAMRNRGYRCALGSVYPFDASIPSAALARRHILQNVRPGAIVILHDGGGRGLRTLQVVREVLPELRRRGYRVVTLSELAAMSAAGAGARATA